MCLMSDLNIYSLFLQSLDDLITMEIIGVPIGQGQRQNSSLTGNRNEYQPRNRQNDRPYRSFNNYQQRPGLKELV